MAEFCENRNKLFGSVKAENCLTFRIIINFSTKTLHHDDNSDKNENYTELSAQNIVRY
jgi:hypothetical protein